MSIKHCTYEFFAFTARVYSPEAERLGFKAKMLLPN